MGARFKFSESPQYYLGGGQKRRWRKRRVSIRRGSEGKARISPDDVEEFILKMSKLIQYQYEMASHSPVRALQAIFSNLSNQPISVEKTFVVSGNSAITIRKPFVILFLSTEMKDFILLYKALMLAILLEKDLVVISELDLPLPIRRRGWKKVYYIPNTLEGYEYIIQSLRRGNEWNTR